MSEFITIQVGQCGNQIGGAFWPLVLDEHGIQNISKKNTLPSKTKDDMSLRSFFTCSNSKYSSCDTLTDLKNSKIKARAVLVDMEDSVVSRYKTGILKDLFDEKCMITSYPGSGNNWAQGYYCHGPRYKNKILNVIRRAADKCDSLQGFLLMFSVGGGTGSGVGTYILKLLEDNFPTVDRFVTCVYPTGTEDVTTCPYNMVLSTNQLIEHASCVFPVENRALLDIVNNQIRNHHSPNSAFVSTYHPYHDLNSVIVNKLLHLTCGSRFSGNFNVDLNEISTNLVPFPNLHFLSSGYSPLTVTTKPLQPTNSRQIKDEIFAACCSRSNQLLKVDPLGTKSVLLGSALIARGDFTVTDIRNYVEKLQNKGRFTSWSKKSIKLGLCNQPPANLNYAMLSLFNSSSVKTLFSHVYELYRKLYQKRAHLHHYTAIPGFEEDLFEECENSIKSQIACYQDIEKNTSICIPRLSSAK